MFIKKISCVETAAFIFPIKKVIKENGQKESNLRKCPLRKLDYYIFFYLLKYKKTSIS